MASIKKKSSGGGGANWMDTYGDMVTLLLCFFVLLYSMSSIDEAKWKIIVQSFNPSIVDETDPPGPIGEDSSSGGNEMPATDVEEAMDELYEYLKMYQQQNQAQAGDILISQGDGYVFISFADAVFFDGNSFTLKPEGKVLLDGIIPALSGASEFIDELQVLGHTAQQYAHTPNPIPADRRLSSNRATEVVIYLQERIEGLDPGRLVVTSYGQWRNVADNGTESERAKNRRVEMIITGLDVESEMPDSLTKYKTMYNTSTTSSD